MKTTYLCGSPWLPDAVPVLGRDHGAERAQPLCPHCPACQATSLEVPSAATVSPEATSLVLQEGDGGGGGGGRPPLGGRGGGGGGEGG